MYNGIGLLTPRGSGTSGYVTANKFNLRRAPPPKDEVRKESDAPKQPKPNEGILLHNRKREIEVKLFELRMRLEDEGELDEEEIEKRVSLDRSVLEETFTKQEQENAKEAKSTTQETHEVARRKMEQMERLRGALNIRQDAKEGEAFDVELQEKRKKEAKEKREERERERQQRAKEEKKRRKAIEEEELQKQKAHDDTRRSREKRKSRDHSSERKHKHRSSERTHKHRSSEGIHKRRHHRRS
eukprot:g6804.t1